jgi:hypothetical protein
VSRVQIRASLVPTQVSTPRADEADREPTFAPKGRFHPGMTTTPYVLNSTMPDFWSLSDTQLERACRMVADGRVPFSPPFLRAEAMRLFLLWRECIAEVAQERDQRACLLAALRKRTIQILVRIALSSDPVNEANCA